MLNFAASIVPRLRYSVIIRARPTAASAAATVRVRNTITCPDMSACTREKVIIARFAAFNISSTDMKVIIKFLDIITPQTPITKSNADTIRKCSAPMGLILSLRGISFDYIRIRFLVFIALGHYHSSHYSDQKQN